MFGYEEQFIAAGIIDKRVCLGYTCTWSDHNKCTNCAGECLSKHSGCDQLYVAQGWPPLKATDGWQNHRGQCSAMRHMQMT
jgi:hypothetical protein